MTLSPSKSTSYKKLLNQLHTLIVQTESTGSVALNKQKIESYWKIGKKLSTPGRETRGFLQTLSQDLTISYTLLYRSRIFYQAWTDGLSIEAKQLPWSHHILLMNITNRTVRNFYIKQTLHYGWGRDTLRKAIVGNAYDTFKELDEDPLHLSRDVNPSYIYAVELDRVVDGDTILVRVDLGFHTWSSQRLRLRGINTAELHSSENSESALTAKHVVETKLQNCNIVIQTFKTDIYGRYIADVYYHETLNKISDIIKDGHFLNQQLLDQGLAKGMLV